MIEFSLVGPVVFIMALSDLILHLQLDFRKIRSPGAARFQEPSVDLPMHAMAMVIVSTLLAFLIVLLIPVAWALNMGAELFHLFVLIKFINLSLFSEGSNVGRPKSLRDPVFTLITNRHGPSDSNTSPNVFFISSDVSDT